MSDAEEAVDARGIPGWDRVNKLAEALLELEGLSLSHSQVQKIKNLYDGLMDINKKALVFSQRKHSILRGRFARARSNNTGHVGVDMMKR